MVEHGDIAHADTADRLVAAATATGLPLRGVLHAAGIVENASLANITDELLARDWAPKVHGAWHLHQALHETEAGEPLDWFCSFSSAAALLGSPGQGAYAAANSWLDAFTHWRRAQGLPATSIAWEAGADNNGAAITVEEGAYAFEALLRHDRAYTGYTTIIVDRPSISRKTTAARSFAGSFDSARSRHCFCSSRSMADSASGPVAGNSGRSSAARPRWGD